MLIILEGPDGAGKSTLAQVIERELHDDTLASVEVWRKGPPTRHPLDEYEVPLLEYRPGLDRHLILDRWHWGERVYPDVLNRSTELDDAMWLHVELFLRSRGAYVVHVDASSAELKRRVTERGDDLIKPVQLAEIRLRFWYVHDDSILLHSTLRSDYVSAWDDERERRLRGQARAIIRVARKHEESARRLNSLVTYVGPPEPDVLLLGDVRGGSSESHGLQPAFVPRSTSSGQYLLTALAEHLPEWKHRLGIANACDVDSVIDLRSALGKPAVVALGLSADLQLKRWDIPHTTVFHPQYWRRFKHHQVQEYADTLRTAMETTLNVASLEAMLTSAENWM